MSSEQLPTYRVCFALLQVSIYRGGSTGESITVPPPSFATAPTDEDADASVACLAQGNDGKAFSTASAIGHSPAPAPGATKERRLVLLRGLRLKAGIDCGTVSCTLHAATGQSTSCSSWSQTAG